MNLRRGLMAQMASNNWKKFTINPASQCTNAGQVKAFFEPYIGTHKRAFAILDTDFSAGYPSVARQFLSAVWYYGFDNSQWTRANSSTAAQTNNSFSLSYWTVTYDLQLAPTDTVILMIDMNS